VDLDVEALRSIEPLLYHAMPRSESAVGSDAGADASVLRRNTDEEKRWRARASCFVGQEPHAHAVVLPRDTAKSRRACNAVMASAPGLAFWTTVLDEVERRSERTRVTRFNPPEITGPIMLTSALEQTGFDARAGGCGVADPPETLFPAMDKSQFALARATCENAGFLVADRERAERECPARALRIEDDGESKLIRLGAPGEVPDLRRACCDLSREGFANPPRETMFLRGAFAVHHWVHTWLDGPDARLSNAWRRRASS